MRDWSHVFESDPSQERRQGAPVLEYCGEPAGAPRPDCTEDGAVSGRDQRRATSRLVSNDRSAGGGQASPAIVVSRGSAAAAGMLCRSGADAAVEVIAAQAMGGMLAGAGVMGAVGVGQILAGSVEAVAGRGTGAERA